MFFYAVKLGLKFNDHVYNIHGCNEDTVKFGYNERLGTGQIRSL